VGSEVPEAWRVANPAPSALTTLSTRAAAPSSPSRQHRMASSTSLTPWLSANWAATSWTMAAHPTGARGVHDSRPAHSRL
jgi:hypothetical protein